MAATRSASKLTQTDKLRAMNNLQSEITRRARGLRAEYARAAQSLRSKLEMRVYRIPKALRNANMGELLQKYIDIQEQGEAQAVKKKTTAKETAKNQLPEIMSPAKPKKPAATSTKAKTQTIQAVEPRPVRAAQAGRPRGTKRTSNIMIAADNNGTDKENEEDIENPKKRSKANTQAVPTRSLRDPSAVLSPKSNNSRTLPQSPVRPPFGVPTKSFNSRPASPLKPPTTSRIPPVSPVRQVGRPVTAASTAGTARAAGTRATKATAASTRATAGTRSTATKASARSASSSTNDSSATSGTTIIRRTGATSRAANTTVSAAAKKATAAATASTAASARRTAAAKAKAETRPATAMGTGRVLRKRA